MHKYSDNRPSRSSRSIGVSYITVTRKHSSRRLCTQLGRATLDLMFKSRITNMRPIREFLCYKVGPPTSELNSYLEKIIKSRLRLVRFSELLLRIPDGLRVAILVAGSVYL